MGPSFPEENRNDAQLEAIFRAHFAGLYRYIYRQVKQAVIAEDLTSAVFVKALRWLQQGRSQESIKGWLYTTARTIIADYWREHTQVQLLPLEAAEEMPLLFSKSNEQMQPLQARIQRLLDRLPSREQQLLILRYFQGYSAAEIGQVLGLSANYVRVLQLRALRRAALLEVAERNVSMESPNVPYNEQALRALDLAREEALAFNHNYIGTEHLLLGLLREGSATTELVNQGLTPERIRGGILFIVGKSTEEIAGPNPGYTPRSQKVLTIAGEEAQHLGESTTSPYHLLVAIMREGSGMAANLLLASGVRMEQVGKTMHFKVIPEQEKEIVKVPLDFEETLQKHPAARTLFEKLSNAKKNKFVEMIEEAQGEEARSQRIEKIIWQLEQISQAQQ